MKKHSLALLALILTPRAALAQAEAIAAPEATAAVHSPLQMFLNADIVVQGVMAGLLLASVLVWTIWLAKLGQIFLSARGLRRGIARLKSAGLQAQALQGQTRGPVAAMVQAALAERQVSAGLARDGIMERATSDLFALEAASQRRLQRGVALIGTVASTAPFIGLFGTVWGIMNSFIGIAATQTTNLAVVAPGIAEALLATGIGLVAAIPALILYNHLSRLLAAHRALLAEVSRRVANGLSRDLDSGAAAGAGA